MKPTKTTLPRLLIGALLLGTLSFGPGGLVPVRAQTGVDSIQPLPASDGAAPELNAFLTADQKHLPPTGGVLFMGSSSIRLWSTLAADFPEIPVINRGFGGSQIFESTKYADRIAAPYKPKLIVMFAGTNDLAYGNKTPAQVLQEFKDFAAKIYTILPDTRLAYISISPTKARWNQEGAVLEANYLIERWIIETNSATQKLSFLDAHSALLTTDGQPPVNLERPDGLHFNAEGYKVWTSLLKPRILALADLEGVQRLGTQSLPTTPKAAPATGVSAMPSTTKIDGKTVTLKTLPSGVKYYDMKVGTGANPKIGQTVSVQYTGTLLDGTKFDSSYDHGGQPIDFPIGVGRVIKGWDEGVPSMKIGGKRRLVIPGDLAYGANSPTPTIPPNATLVFDIELVGVK